METYNLEITFQPLNNCWGVLLKRGNMVHNEVSENLADALFEMAKFIVGSHVISKIDER